MNKEQSTGQSDETLLHVLETNNHLAATIANTVTGVTISDPNTIALIRKAMLERTPITTEVLNYRKDGSSFWNELTISPVCDESGELLYFVGLQADVTRRKEAEQVLQAELELARLVQQSVLSLPVYEPNIEITAAYIPSEQLAGDMYCWYKIDQYRYGILLLDVVGHGISASLIGMSIRSLLQGLITRLVDPVKVIKELNRHMNNLYAGQHTLQSYYFTCIYTVVDTRKRTIEYVNAGHPPGVICTAEGKCMQLNKGSLPVGILPDLHVEKGSVTYETSARIALYTDGLLENKYCAAFHTVEEVQKFFMLHHHVPTDEVKEAAIKAFVQGKKKDDVCLLVVSLS
jgi:sigma-B regulation protein RsbU (phosphoserine phosphatase)